MTFFIHPLPSDTNNALPYGAAKRMPHCTATPAAFERMSVCVCVAYAKGIEATIYMLARLSVLHLKVRTCQYGIEENIRTQLIGAFA